MTPAVRFFRNLWQRWRKAFYDGPETPKRLPDMVLAFTVAYPRATKAEWIGFARKLADESYRSGWTRGFEWAERDLDRRDPVVDPEVLMENEGQDWEWYALGEEPEPSDVDEVVTDEPEDAVGERARHVKEMNDDN